MGHYRHVLSTVVALLLTCAASATIARVQYCQAYTGDSCSLTGTGAGNLLVVAYSYAASGASATCSDGINTWASANTATNSVTTTSLVVEYAANIVGGNVTVTCSTESDPGIVVTEYSGAATASPIDTTATSNSLGGLSSSATWPSVTASANDGVFAAGAAEGGGALSTWTSPFSVIHNTTNHYDSQADDLNVSAGTITPAATLGGNYADNWCGVTVAFKGGGSPPATVVPRHHGGIICCSLP